MATTNGSVRTKRRLSANHVRAVRPARERLRKRAIALSHNLKAMSGVAMESAQEKVGELRAASSEYYKQGREKAHQMERILERHIREHPLTAIAIAAGVGLLLGHSWKRR